MSHPLTASTSAPNKELKIRIFNFFNIKNFTEEEKNISSSGGKIRNSTCALSLLKSKELTLFGLYYDVRAGSTCQMTSLLFRDYPISVSLPIFCIKPLVLLFFCDDFMYFFFANPDRPVCFYFILFFHSHDF